MSRATLKSRSVKTNPAIHHLVDGLRKCATKSKTEENTTDFGRVTCFFCKPSKRDPFK